MQNKNSLHTGEYTPPAIGVTPPAGGPSQSQNTLSAAVNVSNSSYENSPLGSARSPTAEEKQREKERLQEMVKEFAKVSSRRYWSAACLFWKAHSEVYTFDYEEVVAGSYS